MPWHTFETFKDRRLQATAFKARVPPVLLHIRWSGTSRAAQYEAHGLQLELVLGARAGRAFGYSKL